jgi:hypothetical protein
MSNLPISMDQLEKIIEVVARDLLEDWAINDRFSEDKILEATQNAVSDTVFVINGFMSLFNETMMNDLAEKKIIV